MKLLLLFFLWVSVAGEPNPYLGTLADLHERCKREQGTIFVQRSPVRKYDFVWEHEGKVLRPDSQYYSGYDVFCFKVVEDKK